MFLVGLEFDPALLRGRARSAFVISGAGIVVPLVLGIAAGTAVSLELTTLAVLLVVVSAWITEKIGIHALFGGFVVGAAMPRKGGLATALGEKLEEFVTIVLLPLFFAFSGLRTQMGLLHDASDWRWTGALLAVATLVSCVEDAWAIAALRLDPSSGSPSADELASRVRRSRRGLPSGKRPESSRCADSRPARGRSSSCASGPFASRPRMESVRVIWVLSGLDEGVAGASTLVRVAQTAEPSLVRQLVSAESPAAALRRLKLARL